MIVTSHNEKIKNIIKDRSKRLKGLQRALARCKRGSKNRYKIKLKIQRLWQKIRNARKHLIHDITNKLIKENAEEYNINFIGNVEGREAFSGEIDAIITDGFTGNVFLKTVEGLGKFVKRSLTKN